MTRREEEERAREEARDYYQSRWDEDGDARALNWLIKDEMERDDEQR